MDKIGNIRIDDPSVRAFFMWKPGIKVVLRELDKHICTYFPDLADSYATVLLEEDDKPVLYVRICIDSDPTSGLNALDKLMDHWDLPDEWQEFILVDTLHVVT